MTMVGLTSLILDMLGWSGDDEDDGDGDDDQLIMISISILVDSASGNTGRSLETYFPFL